jgi:predicted transcriptional regulator
MRKVTETNFLEKIQFKISNGEFDQEIVTPLLNRELIYNAIKSKLENKEKSGGTPLLSESEIKVAVEDAKTAALESSALFIRLKFLEKNSDGIYELTKLGKLALKEANRLKME